MPPNILPLINAMPPSPTNVIKNDTSYFISEPIFDWFTHSGSNNNTFSNSAPTVTTPKSRCKRCWLVTFIWQLARDPPPYKAIYNSKN